MSRDPRPGACAPAGYTASKYPGVSYTADNVIFTTIEDTVHVLLIERAKAPFAGYWALPGGFVDPNETGHSAALRELEEETGLILRAPVPVAQVRELFADTRQAWLRVPAEHAEACVDALEADGIGCDVVNEYTEADHDLFVYARSRGRAVIVAPHIALGPVFDREVTDVRFAPTVRLHSLGLYDAPRRDPRGRVISSAFTVHVPDAPTPTARDDARNARWVPLSEVTGAVRDSFNGYRFNDSDELFINGLPTGLDPSFTGPRLAFDHAAIVFDAVAAISAGDVAWYDMPGLSILPVDKRLFVDLSDPEEHQ